MLDKAGIAYEKRLASQYPEQVEAFGIRQAPTLVVAKGGNAQKYVGVAEIKGMINA